MFIDGVGPFVPGVPLRVDGTDRCVDGPSRNRTSKFGKSSGRVDSTPAREQLGCHSRRKEVYAGGDFPTMVATTLVASQQELSAPALKSSFPMTCTIVHEPFSVQILEFWPDS